MFTGCVDVDVGLATTVVTGLLTVTDTILKHTHIYNHSITIQNFQNIKGALKMQDMKMQDLKLTDQCAGHEIAGHEIDGPICKA